jgi:hypothetical protein
MHYTLADMCQGFERNCCPYLQNAIRKKKVDIDSKYYMKSTIHNSVDKPGCLLMLKGGLEGLQV